MDYLHLMLFQSQEPVPAPRYPRSLLLESEKRIMEIFNTVNLEETLEWQMSLGALLAQAENPSSGLIEKLIDRRARSVSVKELLDKALLQARLEVKTVKTFFGNPAEKFVKALIEVLTGLKNGEHPEDIGENIQKALRIKNSV